MKKLLLADGNSMLFRAYYATAYGTKMTTAKGLPTNAIFGFANMMQKAIDLVRPDAILVAFDAGKHTFRNDLYADYKGGRKPAPDDLVPQFGMARDYLDAYAIRRLEIPGVEADDLIGTMANRAAGYETTILTSDRDLLQLADVSVRVLLMKKGLTDMDEMTPEKIQEQYGVTPGQIVDLKGLMGDASDNYPGIPGVGEKTAVRLLTEFGSLENILANDATIKGALGNKIRANHESALLSKKLATIQCNVKLDITVADCLFQPDYKNLRDFFNSLDMHTMEERYKNKSSETKHVSTDTAPSSVCRRRVTTIPQNVLTKTLAVVLIDDGASFLSAAVHAIGLSDGTESYCITWEDALKDRPLCNYLMDTAHGKIGFDCKRALHLLKKAGIEAHFDDDAMIAATLTDSTMTTIEKIKEGYGYGEALRHEDIYGSCARPKLPDEARETEYVCRQAEQTFAIFQKAESKIKAYGMETLYRKIEMPLTLVLCDMEEAGVICDRSVLSDLSDSMKAQIDNAQTSIYAQAGHEFNINSPKQLATVLYDELGLFGGKKRSTSAEVLEKLSDVHPIIPYLLEYRKLSKIQSTYAEGLQKYIAADGRIHTLFKQTATQTGRLSSADPNLQNISVRDELGKQVRKAFLPSEGCVLLSSDYHQIELRMLASMAHIDAMMDAFKNNIDVHTRTAMDLFGKQKPEEVTEQERRRAKTVNFGIVYGISDFGLAEQLGVSRQEAQAIIRTYYEKNPGIKTYMDGIVKECEEQGYVTTICGRRRDIPEVYSANHMVREFGKRAAMNAPIQGSAADLIKIAMLAIDKAMEEKNVRSRMILQVHDELIFDVPEEEVELMKELVTEGMTKAMTLDVPLTVECNIGKNWYEAK